MTTHTDSNHPITARHVAAILRRLARDFDIPELAAAEATEPPTAKAAEVWVWRASTLFEPAGQAASTWQEASVQVDVQAMPEHVQTRSHLVVAVRLELSYRHHGGGTNGDRRALVAMVDRDGGRLACLLGEREFRAVYDAGYDEGRAAGSEDEGFDASASK